jgi:hypothetical protein
MWIFNVLTVSLCASSIDKYYANTGDTTMAKIITDTISIDISRIAKDADDLGSLVTEDMVSTLEAVVAELVGEGAVVEVKTQ